MPSGKRNYDVRPTRAARGNTFTLEQITAVLLTIFLLLLHVQFARYAGGLWRDEANTVAIAGMPNWPEMRQGIVAEAKPLLYFVMVRGWMTVFGDSDGAYRALGFAVGVLGVGVMWFNARVFKLSSPIVSLSMIGFAPLAIATMGSIRPYGLSMLLTPLLFALMWRYIERPKVGTLLSATVAAVLCVQAYFNNAFFVLAIGVAALVVLARSNRKAAMLALLPGAIAAASLLPYAAILADTGEWAEQSKLNNVTPVKIVVAFIDAIGVSNLLVFVVWGIVVLATVVRPLIQRVRAGGDGRAAVIGRAQQYAMLVIGIAVLGQVVLLYQLQTQVFSRYLLPLVALVGVSLDVLNATTSSRGRTRMAVAFCVALLAGTTTWNQAHTRQTNMDLAVAEFEKQVGPDDLVVIAPWYMCSSFTRYYKGPAPVVTLPPVPELRVQRDDLFKQTQASFDPVTPLLNRIATVLESGNRVWILGDLPDTCPKSKPGIIPPAPQTKWGWNSKPYMLNWAARLRYLQNQPGYATTKFEANPGQPVNAYEMLAVELVQRRH